MSFLTKPVSDRMRRDMDSRKARLDQIEQIFQRVFSLEDAEGSEGCWGGAEALVLGQDDLFCMRVARIAWYYERKMYLSYPLPRPAWLQRRLAHSAALHFFHDLATCTQEVRDERIREWMAAGSYTVD